VNLHGLATEEGRKNRPFGDNEGGVESKPLCQLSREEMTYRIREKERADAGVSGVLQAAEEQG